LDAQFERVPLPVVVNLDDEIVLPGLPFIMRDEREAGRLVEVIAEFFEGAGLVRHLAWSYRGHRSLFPAPKESVPAAAAASFAPSVGFALAYDPGSKPCR
jgi:hypothetical protein